MSLREGGDNTYRADLRDNEKGGTSRPDRIRRMKIRRDLKQMRQ